MGSTNAHQRETFGRYIGLPCFPSRVYGPAQLGCSSVIDQLSGPIGPLLLFSNRQQTDTQHEVMELIRVAHVGPSLIAYFLDSRWIQTSQFTIHPWIYTP